MSCRERSRIDEHFAGRGSDAALRAHLEDCAGCRAYYQRHLLLERVDPAAPGAEARLAAGLGLRRRRWRWQWRVPAFALASAMVILLLLRPHDGGYVPRGGPAPEGALAVYVARAGGKVVPAGARIRRDDELAFAYTNPRGHQRLLVFAVDEERRVYWYHPEWVDPEQNPTAIPIEPGASLRELPEAVAHRFGGARVEIWGLFVDQPIPVREVEAHVADGTLASWARAPFRVTLTVER